MTDALHANVGTEDAGTRPGAAAAPGSRGHAVAIRRGSPAGHAAWSCGLPFPVCAGGGTAKPFARVKLRTDGWEKLLSGWWAKSLFLFTADTVSKDAHIHARMFAPAMGIAEDPATGSAASALAGFLQDQNRATAAASG